MGIFTSEALQINANVSRNSVQLSACVLQLNNKLHTGTGTPACLIRAQTHSFDMETVFIYENVFIFGPHPNEKPHLTELII